MEHPLALLDVQASVEFTRTPKQDSVSQQPSAPSHIEAIQPGARRPRGSFWKG